MKLKSETYTFRGEKFEIRELTVGQLMPLIEMMGEEGSKAQYEIMKLSVHKDGKPIGDEISDLPGGMLVDVLRRVSEINALAASEDDEGNA